MFGKPAVGVKYVTYDPNTKNEKDAQSKISVVGQFYVKGVGNRLALVVDQNSKESGDSWTDITLAAWFNF